MNASGQEPGANRDEPEEYVPLTEWISVVSWPPEMQDIIGDLERLEHVIALMHGGASGSDGNYAAARLFLADCQRNLRSSLAGHILAIHKLDDLMETPLAEEREL